MQPDSTRTGATNQRKQAIARLISGLMANSAGKELDESAIIAAHPELMPELEAELRKFRHTPAGETASFVAATAIRLTLPPEFRQDNARLLGPWLGGVRSPSNPRMCLNSNPGRRRLRNRMTDKWSSYRFKKLEADRNR
ncbi:MAG TPA: hypothetical protein VHX86_19065 [Tepidisphaeraceae bacterium]|jgi:hypothetical protein|nr:hypothetical protein [Tepidisphaeraceae bacterium]